MRFLSRLSCMMAAMALTAKSAPSVSIYVSPGGVVDADGTHAKPYRSLVEARDAVRRLKAQSGLPSGGIRVELLPGRYEMTGPFELGSEDSGTAEAPIEYRSVERGVAILSGAFSLAQWQSVNDAELFARLAPSARSHVVWAELPEEIPDPVPGFANGGCGYRGKPQYPIALFQNAIRLPMARWPNGTFAKMGDCVGHHEKRGHVGTTYTEGIFQFDNDRLAAWAREPDAWFDGLWFHHWADQKMQLKQIDLASKIISLVKPGSHAFGFKTGQQFFAFNMISEIDRPGEWAVDRASRRIYLWPSEPLNEHPVFVAAADHLVTMVEADHVRMDGLVFEGCRETAVTAEKCTSFILTGSTLRHLGSWGVQIAGGRDCSVIGCDLYDLGQGGIKASGGVRNTLEPGNHLIENNHIHDFGRIVSTYQPGAAVYGVGNKIRHNLIYGAQHQAIFFRGNDHLIEYNIVHDVCLHSSDAGAIYACARDWSQRGTVIRHNLFHALGEGLDGAGCRAIYLDDMTSGVTVQSNIVTMGDCGLNFGGGKDLIVTDNIAINCKTSLNLASRGIDSFARKNAEKGRESTQYKLLLRDEDLFRGELWSKKYPNLLAPLAMDDPVDAQNAHDNTILRNVNVGGGELRISNSKKVMRTCTVADNIDLMSDPGFVDLSGLDLRLKSDSVIYEKFPEFQAPDFQQMGLYADTRRVSPPVKFGSHVSPLSPIMPPEERSQAERPRMVPVPASSAAIRIDGTVNSAEWDPDVASPCSLAHISGGAETDEPSSLYLRTTEDALCIALVNPGKAGSPISSGDVWGQDDGVEIALSSALDARLPTRLNGVILRFFANGSLRLTDDSRPLPQDVFAGIQHAVSRAQDGSWQAELLIPFSAIGVSPEEMNLPIYCHVTAWRAASKQWITWRKRWSLDATDAKCAMALWLQAFGLPAFRPGYPVPVIRIDVQGDRAATSSSMQAGMGASAPDWAVKWNRLVCEFGTARADRWTPCRFEFMPLEDTTVSLEVMGTQARKGDPVVWTYYDAFTVEGAELINGDFEEAGDDGRVPEWNTARVASDSAATEKKAGIVSLGEWSASGKYAAITSHDHRVNQRIKITKGQKVTVSFQARAALAEDLER